MVKDYTWSITIKKYHVGTGWYMHNGIKTPLDMVSSSGFLVKGKNIKEALDNAEKKMQNEDFNLKDYTICDVYCATFDNTNPIVIGSF